MSKIYAPQLYNEAIKRWRHNTAILYYNQRGASYSLYALVVDWIVGDIASVECRWRLLHLSLLCGITEDVRDARRSHSTGDVQIATDLKRFSFVLFLSFFFHVFSSVLLLVVKVARTI